LLYNGALGFIDESMAALKGNDTAKAHQANDRVQSIIRELAATLDMQYELSKKLSSLYEYLEHRLQTAKLENDPTILAEVKSLLAELRDTWEQATAK
jgi:flagellar protein FliS